MVRGSCKVVYQPVREVIYSTVLVEPIRKTELDCGGGMMGRVDCEGGMPAEER